MTIRKAKIADIAAIHNLVKAFATARLMLPLSIGAITERLRDFYLLEIDGEPTGCVAVHVVWDELVEVRSLAVKAECQRRGYGAELVRTALADARDLGAKQIFTLTFVPDFFTRQGFQLIDRHALPHKVWQDCTHCPFFPDCGETALARAV